MSHLNLLHHTDEVFIIMFHSGLEMFLLLMYMIDRVSNRRHASIMNLFKCCQCVDSIQFFRQIASDSSVNVLLNNLVTFVKLAFC